MTDQAKERALWFAYSCTECGALYPHPSFKCGGIGGFNDHPEAGTRLVKVVPASALEERDRVLGELRGALAELVRLKDGPRDEEYHQLKPEAWDRARVALARTTQGGEAVVPGVNSTPARIETRPTLSPSEPCPECEGSGSIWRTDTGYDRTLYDCPTCHGTGKAESVEAAMKSKIRDLEASLAAAERRAENGERMLREERELFGTTVQSLGDTEQELAAAERRLGIAREALERIADGWTDPHYHARAALDGEGEE